MAAVRRASQGAEGKEEEEEVQQQQQQEEEEEGAANWDALHEGPRSYSAVVLEGPGLYRIGIIDLLQVGHGPLHPAPTPDWTPPEAA